MNIKDNHTIDHPISEKALFEGDLGITSAVQILEGIQIENKISKVPALLICVEGKIIFQDDKGKNETLNPGDIINIDPMVKHRFRGISNSQILVLK